jgi:hypothetical protein
VIDDGAARLHLEKFLQRKGRLVAELREQVSDAFGPPLLTVAAGSVVQGFGNEESDLDVMVVVDAPHVTDFPINSHVLGLPVEVNYLDAGWARAAGEVVRAGYLPPARGSGRAGWKDGYRRLTRVGRLTVGLCLDGGAGWQAWQHEMRDALPAYVVGWWRAECLRHRTAARLLTADRPLLAGQQYCDAGMAALEALAAAAGELYVGPKWIGAKLARSGTAAQREAYRALLDLPVTDVEVAGYAKLAEELIIELAGPTALPDDPTVVLTLQPDVTVHRVHDRVLVHRHGIHGLELRDTNVVFPSDGVIWRGLASALDGDRLALAMRGLVWLTAIEGDVAAQ